MSRFDIELDSAGIENILKGSEIQSMLEDIANNAVASCEGNYDVNSTISRDRCVVNIKTADKETYFKNLKSNELIKATSPNKRNKR